MPLCFYNTKSRKKEIFKPIKEGNVSLYTCGPTVYSFVHIGNLRTFLFEDVLVRYLKYKGYKVKQIMNLTDVDDKTIKGANANNISLDKYTYKYKKAFFEDIDILSITKATHYPCATEHIDDMVKLIEKLLDKSLAYRSKDRSIYFSIRAFSEYGKLSAIDKRELKVGASGRVFSDEYDKDNINDFVLWKAYTDADKDVFWDTSIGKGRPGWHIECSAMSMYYLGESFDIHTGGVDNIFPHHENEIAQSSGATGKSFVNYWLHSEFLNIKGEKSSKSSGNTVYLKDLLKKGHSAKSIRLCLISAHYRSKLSFSEELIKQAKANISSINSFIARCWQIEVEKPFNKELVGLIAEKKAQFEFGLDDDLNMPLALSSLFELIREVNKIILSLGKEDGANIIAFFRQVNSILEVFSLEEDILEEEIKLLVEKREAKRANREYEEADKIRAKLADKGIVLKDSAKGVIWHRQKA